MLDAIARGISTTGGLKDCFPMLILYRAADRPVKITCVRDIAPGVSFRVIATRVAPGGPEDLLPLQAMINGHIRRVLDACNGDRARASKILDMTSETVFRWATVNDYTFDAAEAP